MGVYLLYLACATLVVYTGSIRNKKVKEKPNTVANIIIAIIVVVIITTGIFTIYTDIAFFEEYAFVIYTMVLLVQSAINITDIAFGTFSKSGTVRKQPKKRPVWYWVAWIVGSIIVMNLIIIGIILHV
ncbi:MAG: hypothetical protein FWB93_05115 [Oscillospiraceae bacterium]|nr:hypothetical protein [Oscillospiraceae bacterium]